MTEVPVVDADALADITTFCVRAIAQPFTADELRDALFAPDQPALVRFDPAVGLVATVTNGPDAYIRLLAVAPEQRRRGHGRRLLDLAERDHEDARTITVGADAPYFLFPGVPTSETALCALLERAHFTREETNYNMVVRLDPLPPDDGTAREPARDDRTEIAAWMENHWAHWTREVLRAFDKGSLVITRDEHGIAGFCAFDVNRHATLGPIASRPDLVGRGAGRALLAGGLHRLRARGYDQIDVLWVGPFVPYARVGGTVGELFFVYRKHRRA
jgi:mycothiol synthase